MKTNTFEIKKLNYNQEKSNISKNSLKRSRLNTPDYSKSVRNRNIKNVISNNISDVTKNRINMTFNNNFYPKNKRQQLKTDFINGTLKNNSIKTTNKKSKKFDKFHYSTLQNTTSGSKKFNSKIEFTKIKEKEEYIKSLKLKLKLKHGYYNTNTNIYKKNNISLNKSKENSISKDKKPNLKKRTHSNLKDNSNKIMTPIKNKKTHNKSQLPEFYHNKTNTTYINMKKTIDYSISIRQNYIKNKRKKNISLITNSNNHIYNTLNNSNNCHINNNINKKNKKQKIINLQKYIKIKETRNNSQKNIIKDIYQEESNPKPMSQIYNQMADNLKIKTDAKNSNSNSIIEKVLFSKNIKKLSTSTEKIFKGKYIDKIGVISMPGEITFGVPKINQDNYFNYDLCNNYKYIGVCDGHGEDGHHISEYTKNTLPEELNTLLENLISVEKKNLNISSDIELKDDIELRKKIEKIDNIKNILIESFKITNISSVEELSMYDLEFSGSTCVSIFLHKLKANKMFIANIGDSRAILIKKNNNIYKFQQLSRDHKPSEEDEAQRILNSGGEIQKIEDENGNETGPLRIWIKNSDGPGLAMTRSFCDIIASTIGVICIPEIFEYKLKEEDKCIIIASDGLFEYVSNEKITEIVGEFLDNKNNDDVDENVIVRELYKEANAKWKVKDNGIDDITIMCVLLKNS